MYHPQICKESLTKRRCGSVWVDGCCPKGYHLKETKKIDRNKESEFREKKQKAKEKEKEKEKKRRKMPRKKRRRKKREPEKSKEGRGWRIMIAKAQP